MKTLLVVLVVAVIGTYSAPADPFDSKFDKVNVDEILKNERLLKNMVNCITSTENKKCTAEGNQLKAAIPLAIQDTCAKCTPAQKEMATKVIPVLCNKHPEKWVKIVQHFDPKGEYKGKYQDLAVKYNAPKCLELLA